MQVGDRGAGSDHIRSQLERVGHRGCRRESEPPNGVGVATNDDDP